jgi:hypothetical protein
MILREIITVSSENHNEPINMVSGQTSELILNQMMLTVITVLQRIRNKHHNSLGVICRIVWTSFLLTLIM